MNNSPRYLYPKQSFLELCTRIVIDELLPAALAILWVLYALEVL